MRRTTSVVAVSLMLIVMVSTAVSASGETYSAAGGTGPAGGTLSVGATVHNAAPGSTFSAVALVHFATGNVSITFGPGDTTTTTRVTRHHEGHWRHHPHWWRRHHHRPGPKPAPQPGGVDLTATTQVPIAGEEPFGTVPIDVTITYGGRVTTVSTTGQVEGYGN
jgi:hypothetical protein